MDYRNLKSQISKSVKTQNEEWLAHNDAIASFFQSFPENKLKRYVIPKLVIIDRIYLGSLYRLGQNRYSRELYSLADAIILNSPTIDELFSDLKDKRKYNMKYRDECIETFDKTLRSLKNPNRQVFLSKYFHFHVPLFFPIIDHYSEKKIFEIDKEYNLINDKSEIRNKSRYAKFYHRIEKLYLQMNQEFTFSQLDCFLYGNRDAFNEE
jgi:hypothetical protein